MYVYSVVPQSLFYSFLDGPPLSPTDHRSFLLSDRKKKDFLVSHTAICNDLWFQRAPPEHPRKISIYYSHFFAWKQPKENFPFRKLWMHHRDWISPIVQDTGFGSQSITENKHIRGTYHFKYLINVDPTTGEFRACTFRPWGENVTVNRMHVYKIWDLSYLGMHTFPIPYFTW